MIFLRLMYNMYDQSLKIFFWFEENFEIGDLFIDVLRDARVDANVEDICCFYYSPWVLVFIIWFSETDLFDFLLVI